MLSLNLNAMRMDGSPYFTDSTEATRLLKAGEVVAIPTETVYGLAADATNDTAIAKIYAYKSRPQFNPLIVHVLDWRHCEHYANPCEKAHRLAEAFWPGPLTLVLPSLPQSSISPLCRAGLPTIALRSPSHPVARKILKETGLPLAAPSANPSTHLSPTKAEHVKQAFQGVSLPIVEGGECAIGLESTIVDVSTSSPALLRHGSILKEFIEAVLGEALEDHTRPRDGQVKSPGQMIRHYAPSKPLRLNVTTPREGDGYLAFGPYQGFHHPILNLSPSGDLIEAAAHFFSMLHQLQMLPITEISVAPIPMKGLGLAINDKLRRAACLSPHPDQ